MDFEAARPVFDGPTLEFPDERQDYGEQRIGAFGEAAGTVLFVVYTLRGDRRRIISVRKAGSDERKFYYARLTEGGTDHE